jgi:hypothetical protein
LKASLKGVNRQRIKDGYEKIHDMVSGFRDNEGVVDGQQFTRIRPEAVKEIQRIQQEVENLRNLSERLKGLVSFRASHPVPIIP